MSLRLLASTSLLTAAALAASPALAQQIYYEDGDYLFALPQEGDPEDSVVTETLAEPAIEQEPVLRTGDGESDVVTAQRVIPTRARTTPAPAQQLRPRILMPAQQVVYAYPVAAAPMVYAPAAGAPRGYVTAARSIPAQSVPATGYGYAAQQPGYLPGGGRLVEFDRAAWIEECRARLDTYEDSDRAQVLGALVGAAGGGLIGNRVAGSGDRLGGTLIGAGTGALAGAVVGDAIDDANDARSQSREQCAAYLDDYIARASQAGPPTSTVPGQQYMLVPVTVQVARQPVYRDIVTTED